MNGMNAKEYGMMKKLAKKAIDGEELTVEEAVTYLLLMEKSQAMDVIKTCQAVIRKDAAGRKKSYGDALGTIDVGEPYVRAVNEEDFKRDKPEEYMDIISKKAEKIHLTLDDLHGEDLDRYTHFVKGTAKVKVRLA